MSEAKAGPLSDDQRRALAPALDGFIPPSADGVLPGAGQLGLAADLDAVLRRDPELHAQVVASLAGLDRLAGRRGAARFTALSAGQQAEVLAEVASSEHAFPPMLLLYTFACYYKHPRILAHYGFEARPPHPKGYEVAPTDLALLDPVRRRGPIHRTC
ncbi:MAG TPA: gluconate 2-dehydrogenase subunit 3 family protein [Candidatus Binatia bacterium]|nr:gluconate 2-dehydrogenase subunit 3 family protein [Candidatus Binatia bacterium]